MKKSKFKDGQVIGYTRTRLACGEGLKFLVFSSAPEICSIEGAGVGGTLNFIGPQGTDLDRDRPHPSLKRR